MMNNVKILGQVFTPDNIVNKMLSLKKNTGTVLEPSAGDGAFSQHFKNIVAIEIDAQVCQSHMTNMNFFDYSENNKFDTIIGNPPYVKYKNIDKNTQAKLQSSHLNERTNLYIYFIEKCVNHLNAHGELIFIVPRDFIKASGCVQLNKQLYKMGTITHWCDLGDNIIFPGFNPNCVIFRFEKDNFTRQTLYNNESRQFSEKNGLIYFTEKNYTVNFSSLFFVKVGAVSGADNYFIHEKGNKEFVFSKTQTHNQTKKMFYNVKHDYLEPYKEELLNRKVRVFNEKNWFMWGRNYFESEKERIYVNVKTRQKNPFFLHPQKAYDGSVLAIFPHREIDSSMLANMCNSLNTVNWEELGFVCDGRFIFTQRSLEQTVLPEHFNTFKNNPPLDDKT